MKKNNVLIVLVSCLFLLTTSSCKHDFLNYLRSDTVTYPKARVGFRVIPGTSSDEICYLPLDNHELLDILAGYGASCQDIDSMWLTSIEISVVSPYYASSGMFERIQLETPAINGTRVDTLAFIDPGSDTLTDIKLCPTLKDMTKYVSSDSIQDLWLHFMNTGLYTATDSVFIDVTVHAYIHYKYPNTR